MVEPPGLPLFDQKLFSARLYQSCVRILYGFYKQRINAATWLLKCLRSRKMAYKLQFSRQMPREVDVSMVSNLPKYQRLGFHYYPDSLHFTNADAESWLAELKSLGASWLVISAPIERAIPEEFLQSLLREEIEPILHFKPRFDSILDKNTLKLLLNQYSRWGARYVMFYDRPNQRSCWSSASWSQVDLVDRFLDKFIPCAEMVHNEGMTPLFPVLEPGGDYWDLSFLRSALASMQRRGMQELLAELVLGACARLIDRPVDWGAGGPERWPQARPYRTLPGSQDHRGFHIFEWYQAASGDILGEILPVVLFEVGYCPGEGEQTAEAVESQVAGETLTLLNHLAGSKSPSFEHSSLEKVLACCFPLVPAPGNQLCTKLSWYRGDGKPRPVVDAAKRWLAGVRLPQADRIVPVKTEDLASIPTWAEVEEGAASDKQASSAGDLPLINHYILLPLYAWGAADWDFELISPLLREAHPTVGFSLHEASRAERVTVVGGPGVFSDEAITMLRNSGCMIERLLENGTVIAS